MWVSGQHHVSAALPPGKRPQYPFYRRLGGPQGLSGRVVKMWPPSGFYTRKAQPVSSCYVYTHYTILSHIDGKFISLFCILVKTKLRCCMSDIMVTEPSIFNLIFEYQGRQSIFFSAPLSNSPRKPLGLLSGLYWGLSLVVQRS